jgi:hypothetical protein
MLFLSLIGALIGAVVAAVSMGMQAMQQKQQENTMRNAMKKQENQAAMTNRKNILVAMSQAATNSTAMRIDKSIADSKLQWMKKTGGEGGYRINSEGAHEARMARLSRPAGRPHASL